MEYIHQAIFKYLVPKCFKWPKTVTFKPKTSGQNPLQNLKEHLQISKTVNFHGDTMPRDREIKGYRFVYSFQANF